MNETLVQEELFRNLLLPGQGKARRRFTMETSIPCVDALRASEPSCFLMMEKFDPTAMLEEVEKNQELFTHSTRQKIMEQQHTETIFLRRPDYSNSVLKTNFNVQDTVATAYFRSYPVITSTIDKFVSRHGGGQVGLISIVRLKPGMVVYPHFDRGLYYAVRDRYHFVLQSEGSEMTCAEVASVWQPGEAWWFNNKLVHSAKNLGRDWRIHIIFDVLPEKNVGLSEAMRQWAESNQIE